MDLGDQEARSGVWAVDQQVPQYSVTYGAPTLSTAQVDRKRQQSLHLVALDAGYGGRQLDHRRLQQPSPARRVPVRPTGPAPSAQLVVLRLERENELREAIEGSLIEVHYQPIVDLATGRLRAFEALARWPREWAPVSPAEFIPIAEETGLIGPLGYQIMQRSLRALSAWRRQGLVADDICMSVNVSGLQLEDPQLPSQVRTALADAGLPPDALRLEITESTLMHEHQVIAETIAGVCDSGVGLHLDDFGTGYSSLATLHRCPVGALKIDRSFVAPLRHEGRDNDVIIRSTIALAHSLGLYVIAEGIEDVGQLRHLRSLGCEYGQGFLFSRPVSSNTTCTMAIIDRANGAGARPT